MGFPFLLDYDSCSPNDTRMPHAVADQSHFICTPKIKKVLIFNSKTLMAVFKTGENYCKNSDRRCI